MSIPDEYVLPPHVCRPTALSGFEPHHAPADLVIRCACGVAWTPKKVPHARICACGWERVNTKETNG